MKNGKLATTDNENMEVASAHFHTVYNNQKDITPNVLDKLSNRNIVENIDAIPTFAEFNKNLDNLANDKAPGENGITPYLIKALDQDICMLLYNKLLSFGKAQSTIRVGTEVYYHLYQNRDETSLTLQTTEESLSWTCSQKYYAKS
jgi:hypothetical protein